MQATVSPISTNADVSTTHQTGVASAGKQLFVFILELKDGRIAAGQGTNPSKRISTINSGLNPSILAALCVSRIVGIREATADRNIITVCQKLLAVYGESLVVAV